MGAGEDPDPAKRDPYAKLHRLLMALRASANCVMSNVSSEANPKCPRDQLNVAAAFARAWFQGNRPQVEKLTPAMPHQFASYKSVERATNLDKQLNDWLSELHRRVINANSEQFTSEGDDTEIDNCFENMEEWREAQQIPRPLGS